MFAATASYTLLDNHELGNRSLQSGGAPPAAPQGTPDPALDVNNTGRYHNKTVAFQTIEKSYLDYHPTRAAIDDSGVRYERLVLLSHLRPWSGTAGGPLRPR